VGGVGGSVGAITGYTNKFSKILSNRVVTLKLNYKYFDPISRLFRIVSIEELSISYGHIEIGIILCRKLDGGKF